MLRPSHSTGTKWVYIVKCDCGTEKKMVGSEVKRVDSCGCLKGKASTHGMSAHPAYWVWRSMRDRCRLPSHQAYHNYGGRGITVCRRWDESFANFWEDMGASYQSGLDLDRRDNMGNYEVENCHWVSRKENCNNKRNSFTIKTPKGNMTVLEASEVFGVGVSTIAYRIANGWPIERLFDKPDFRNRV